MGFVALRTGSAGPNETTRWHRRLDGENGESRDGPLQTKGIDFRCSGRAGCRRTERRGMRKIRITIFRS
jgi:hypothetical protein